MSSKKSPVSITATADLHGHLPDMYPCDLAVICGDIFPGGMDKEPEAQGEWFHSVFLPWVQRIGCERAILVPGNHDHWVQAQIGQLKDEYASAAGQKLVILSDCGMEFRGLSIYGTPWVPTPARNKAFSTDDREFLGTVYSWIPQRLDLLLSHTLPKDCGGLDCNDGGAHFYGSSVLRKAVEARDIRYLIGGHIHQPQNRFFTLESNGHRTEIANVSHCNNKKHPIFPPHYMVIMPQPQAPLPSQ